MMMYPYECTHSEHGGAPRAKIKKTEEVKMLIRQFNTFFLMENRGDFLMQ